MMDKILDRSSRRSLAGVVGMKKRMITLNRLFYLQPCTQVAS